MKKDVRKRNAASFCSSWRKLLATVYQNFQYSNASFAFKASKGRPLTFLNESITDSLEVSVVVVV